MIVERRGPCYDFAPMVTQPELCRRCGRVLALHQERPGCGLCGEPACDGKCDERAVRRMAGTGGFRTPQYVPEPRAADPRSEGIARAVERLNDQGIMNCYRRDECPSLS